MIRCRAHPVPRKGKRFRHEVCTVETDICLYDGTHLAEGCADLGDGVGVLFCSSHDVDVPVLCEKRIWEGTVMAAYLIGTWRLRSATCFTRSCLWLITWVAPILLHDSIVSSRDAVATTTGSFRAFLANWMAALPTPPPPLIYRELSSANTCTVRDILYSQSECQPSPPP